MTIVEETRTQVLAKKSVFTGSKKDDYAESTGANETFKLGAGDDKIYFDAKEGFGKDTVVLAKNEKLDLDIKNATDVTYELQGKNVVVNAKYDVTYVLEAKASGTMEFQYTGEGDVTGTHSVNFENEPVSFTLNQYVLSDAVLESGEYGETQKQLHDNGSIMWKSDFTLADKNYDVYKSVSTYLDNGDCTAGQTTDGYGINYTDIKVYKVVNGEKIDITAEYKASLAGATDYFDFSHNSSLLGEQGDVTSSIVLKDYASKDFGGELTINGNNVFVGENGYVFDATYNAKKKSFTGTVLNDQATSTTDKETFKLGAGYNTINFDANEGFGTDTVTLTKGETLDLDIKNATDVTYEIKGKDVVVNAKYDVTYVLEAKASGTMEFQYTGEGDVTGTHSVNFENEPVSFTLNQYVLSDAVLESGEYGETQKQLHDNGSIMWKSDFTLADKNYDVYKSVSTYLDNGDCTAGQTTDGYGINYTDIKVYKVVNGEKIDITEEYKASLAGTTDYFDFSHNSSLLGEQGDVTSSIVLKNLASKDLGATVNVGNDVLNSYVFDAAYDAKKSSFTGTWLNENIDVSAYAGGKKGAGVTINAGAGNDIITDSKFNDTIKAGVGDDIINLSAGNDAVTAGAGKNTVNVDVFEGFGTKTFNLTKGEDLTINLGEYLDAEGNPQAFEYETISDGKNYIVNIYAETETDEEGPLLGTLKFANYVSKDVLGTGSVKIVTGDMTFDLSESQVTMGENTIDTKVLYFGDDLVKKNKLTGTRLNDFVDASEYEDAKGKGVTINAGAGNDTIIGSQYNDTITGGAGVNTLVLGLVDTVDVTNENGEVVTDENGTTQTKDVFLANGNDTYVLTKGETLQLGLANYKFEDLTFTKSGNNLVVTLPGEDAGSVTLKNYFKTNATVLVGDYTMNDDNDAYIEEKFTNAVDLAETIKNGDIKLLINAAAKGGALSDSAYNDIITGSAKADKITVTAGHDVITAGAGNDTITIKGGSQEIVIGALDGNDTIVGANKSERLDLTISGAEGTELSYERKGNNLVITRMADPVGTKTANKAVKTVYIDADGQLTTTKTSEKVTSELYQLADGKYTTVKPEEGTEYTVASTKWYLKDGEFTSEQYTYSPSYSTTTVKDYFKTGGELYINGLYAGDDDVVVEAGVNTLNLGEGNNTFTISNATESRDVAEATVERGVSTVTTGSGDDTFNFGTGKYTANITAGAGKDTFDFTDGWFYDKWIAEEGVIKEGNKVNIADFSKDDKVVLSEYQAGFLEEFAKNPMESTERPSCNLYYNVTVDADGNATADYSNVTISLDKDTTVKEVGNFKTGINLVGTEGSNVLAMGNIVDENGNAIVFNQDRLNTITDQVADWLRGHYYNGKNFASVEEALKAGQTDVLKEFQAVKETTHNLKISDENAEDSLYEIGTRNDDTYNINADVDPGVKVRDFGGNDTYNVNSYDGDVYIADSYGNDEFNINATANDLDIFFDVYADGVDVGGMDDPFGDDDGVDVGNTDDPFGDDDEFELPGFGSEDSFDDQYDDPGVALTMLVKNQDGEYHNGIITVVSDFENGGTTKTIKTSDGAEYVFNAERVAEITSAVQSWLADHTDYTCSTDAILGDNAEDAASILAVFRTGEYTPVEQQPTV